MFVVECTHCGHGIMGADADGAADGVRRHFTDGCPAAPEPERMTLKDVDRMMSGHG